MKKFLLSTSANCIVCKRPFLLLICSWLMSLPDLSAQRTMANQAVLIRHLSFSAADPDNQVREWQVPQGGPFMVKITAKGAKGKDAPGASGALGDVVTGEFLLHSGETLVFIAGELSRDKDSSNPVGGASRVYIKGGPDLMYARGGENAGNVNHPDAIINRSIVKPIRRSSKDLKIGDVSGRHLKIFKGTNDGGAEIIVDVVPGDGGGGTPTYVGHAALSIVGGGTSTSVGCAGSTSLSIAIEEVNSLLQQQTNLNAPYTVTYQDNNGNQYTVTGYNSGDAIAVSPSQTSTYSLVSVTDDKDGSEEPSGTPTVTVNCGPALATVMISADGNTTVCSGSSTKLSVVISGGVSPYTVIYTDGTKNYEVGNYISGTDISVTPVASPTAYTLVSVTDANNVTSAALAGNVAVSWHPVPHVVVVNPAAICPTGTADLTAGAVTAGSDAGLTYSYFADVLETSPIQTPAAVGVGTYYIVGTSQAGCSSLPQLVTISAAAAPTVTVAGTKVCAGSTASLMASAAGASNPTFTWYALLPINIGQQTSGNPQLNYFPIFEGANYTSPVLNGDITFYVTVTDATSGCTSGYTPVSIMVAMAPTVSVIPPIVCSGSTATVTASSPDASSPAFTWYSVATNPSDGSNSYTPVYTGTSFTTPALTSPSSYGVSVSDGLTTCTSDISEFTVAVAPIPKEVITNPQAVCSPATIDLTSLAVTAGSDAGMTFTYFSDIQATVPVQNPAAVGAGIYYIVGSEKFQAASETQGNGLGTGGSGTGPQVVCSTSPEPVTAIINPLPEISSSGTTTTCAGSSATLSASSSDASSPTFLWYALDGPLSIGGQTKGSGGLTLIYTGTPFTSQALTADTAFYASVTDGVTGCTAFDGPMAVSVNPTPTLASVSQATAVCDGVMATINLTGLLPGTTQSLNYSIGSGATITTVSVSSDQNGNGSFSLPLSYTADNGQVLTVTAISIAAGGITCTEAFTINNSTPLMVNPLTTANISTASEVTAVSTGNIASVDNAGTGAVYSWSISGGTITAGAGTNTIMYTAGPSGNISLSVSVTGPNGCKPVASGVLLIAITALPCPNPAISTPWVVCSNSSGNIASVKSVAGNTYVWKINNGTITSGAGSSSISYAAGTTGFVTISVTVTNASKACTVSSGNYLILLSPLPNANICASPSVCASSTGNIAYVPYAGPGATYAWTIQNGTITAGSKGNIIAFTATSAGTVTLGVTVSNFAGCKSSSSNKSIAIVSIPVATITAPASVCSGSSGNKASVGNAGTNAHYAWNIKNGILTAGTNTSSITYTAGNSGSVTLAVTVTNGSGCKATSGNKSVAITSSVKPIFAAIAAQCQNAKPPALPATSTNGISGTWNPSAISTTAIGTKTYTFTPVSGTCATTISMAV